MLVPYYGCAREYAAQKDDILKIVDEVLSTGQVLQGHWVSDFEKQLAQYVGRNYAVAVGSCTDALFFALKALGIGEGDKVLVPNFTFPASATCILRAKAIPVFVDVNEHGNMDLAQAEKFAPDAKAMVYVHLYGCMDDQIYVGRFADHFGLKIVEDAAQALGSYYEGIKAGRLGDISCFSFDPTKPVSAPGSGGAVLFDDLKYDYISMLRYHGKYRNNFEVLGYNSQMSSLTSAILSHKLKDCDDAKIEREYVAHEYLTELDWSVDCLSGSNGVRINNWHKFVIQTDKRDELQDYLTALGIETKVHYQSPLSAMPVFKGYGFGDDMYPNSFKLARTVLSLPCHSYLTPDEVGLVVQGIKNFFRGK